MDSHEHRSWCGGQRSGKWRCRRLDRDVRANERSPRPDDRVLDTAHDASNCGGSNQGGKHQTVPGKSRRNRFDQNGIKLNLYVSFKIRVIRYPERT
jgi:hypothetical protein